ncbi:hypothetical protein THOM_2729 [Trachipleistophora hominis]|uniref:Uncharacterized protein n=1 Tax=Trachipleistophora hominis TaxID=72359 RepID=L7JTJ1_TRAHO|nr:hypothetical protein THOM_2729 [Trachipleistophora hominis]
MWSTFFTLAFERLLSTQELTVYGENNNSSHNWDDVLTMIIRRLIQSGLNGADVENDNGKNSHVDNNDGNDTTMVTNDDHTNVESRKNSNDDESHNTSTNTFIDLYPYDTKQRGLKCKNFEWFNVRNNMHITTLVDSSAALNATSLRNCDEIVVVNTPVSTCNESSLQNSNEITSVKALKIAKNKYSSDEGTTKDCHQEYFTLSDFTLLYDY